MAAYYNEIDPAAAHILRAQIASGVIAPGDVDERSIKEVNPDDLIGYAQCHFFAGGGLWSVAARLAGWPDDEPLWTGSCPCQPFSAAGKGTGTDDPRHLWPDLHSLIGSRRPVVVMGEQVAGAPGYGWFDGVRLDLEGEGYASRSIDFPACGVDAPHQRNRQYWVASSGVDQVDSSRVGRGQGKSQPNVLGGRTTATGADASGVTQGDAFGEGLEGFSGDGDHFGRPAKDRPVAASDGPATTVDMGHAAGDGREQGKPWSSIARYRDQPSSAFGSDGLHADTNSGRRAGWAEGEERQASERTSFERNLLRNGTAWSDSEWIICHDGKARRAKPGVRLLAHGVLGRVDLWRVGGNAIVPQAAAEVIGAFIDVYGLPSQWRAAA
ncbi:MAG: cytosine methyltransferase [Marmoricola sp.]|nr:cytosine methyltransferase [Marmoricola sp.]